MDRPGDQGSTHALGLGSHVQPVTATATNVLDFAISWTAAGKAEYELIADGLGRVSSSDTPLSLHNIRYQKSSAAARLQGSAYLVSFLNAIETSAPRNLGLHQR